jgi:hypothetical protein
MAGYDLTVSIQPKFHAEAQDFIRFLRTCMKTVHFADNSPYGRYCVRHGSHG